MEKLTFIITLGLVCGVICIHAADEMESAWQKYLLEFPLELRTKSEYGIRKSIFEETHAKIREHNAKLDANFEMAHNVFSVMTQEEKQSYFGVLEPVISSNATQIYSHSRQLPADIDYRFDNCMPPVRNQAGCGTWAHSATAVVEFGKCKKSGETGLDFSEQQLIDCAYEGGYNGCSSGWENKYWEYLASNGGQALESCYPYTAKAGQCMFSSSQMKIGAQITSNAVESILSKDIHAMKTILFQGRILSIFIQLPDSFVNYKSGVFDDDKCIPQRPHAMNIVGYSRGFWKFNVALWKWEWQNVEHWILRNSWGAGWGEAGYVRIKLGVNLCQIESFARTTNVI